MVAASTDLVGYSLYLDLLGPLADPARRGTISISARKRTGCATPWNWRARANPWRWSVRAMPGSTPWRRWCSNCSTRPKGLTVFGCGAADRDRGLAGHLGAAGGSRAGRRAAGA
jgi:hypothetical protein